MKRTKGFTLIELMIVCAIVGILAAVAIDFLGDDEPSIAGPQSLIGAQTDTSESRSVFEAVGEQGEYTTVCMDGLELWRAAIIGTLTYKQDRLGNPVTC